MAVEDKWTALDGNFEGLVKSGSMVYGEPEYVYDGDLKIDSSAVIRVPLRVTGTLEVEGKIVGYHKIIVGALKCSYSLETCGDLYVGGYCIIGGYCVVKGGNIVDGFQSVNGYQTVHGFQRIGGYQEVAGKQFVGNSQDIGGHQIIHGDQEIRGSQEVEGNQTIKGNQTISFYKEVGGVQKISGDIVVYSKKTDFAVTMMVGDFKIRFTTKIIEVNGFTYTPQQWAAFTDKEIDGKGRNMISWREQWKDFTLATHANLVDSHKPKVEQDGCIAKGAQN